ncbi:MAG: SAM-dependent methyltransferase [Acidimicrobiia bacterium]
MGSDADTFTVRRIGTVRSERSEPVDDGWDAVVTRIELDGTWLTPDVVAGLDAFSHLDVVFLFHLVDEADVTLGARRPRGRADWPKVGILSQRAKARPNRLGVTTCRLIRVDGLVLHVEGLDAIDGTPVLDIKPNLAELWPRGEHRQPAWSTELMADYW